MLRRACATVLCFTACAGLAAAQDPAPATSGGQPDVAAPAPTDTRPATTTFLGDTGLWFVPTGEVLPAGRWSASGYYTNFDYEQGFTDVSDYTVTFGWGLADRAEIFGAWRLVTRIDRDIRPLFTANTEAGGVVNEYPLVREGWTGNQLGDLYLGAKVNLLSEYRQHPAALAIRGLVKLPTGDDESGAGTGKPDFLVDAIVSKELTRVAEVTGSAGFIFRGDPDDIDLSNGFRWGFGVGGPTRSPLRLFTEFHGEIRLDDAVTIATPRIAPLAAVDGSLPPGVSETSARATWTFGLNYQLANGLFLGTAANWDLPVSGRSDFGPYEDESLDNFSLQFRVGYHPGARVYVAPIPPAPTPPAPPANRGPTVKARCNPCTVEVGKSSTLTADGQDPDGDTLTYKWAAPSGRFANPGQRESLWTAPDQEGSVPATVTVDDGKGGTATDSVTVQVVRPAVKSYTFEDVHFDFDRYTLREAALAILGDAVKTMRENPELRIEIEGHTCNIGTAEYNLALGERRAHAVRDYLLNNGIAADRLRTVSYGEERPKHDNGREETRRLNRRAALVVRVQ